MWIVILVITVYSFLRRKKKNKSKEAIKSSLLLVFFLLSIISSAQFSVSGKIYPVNEKGDMYIFLIDESHFGKRFSGLRCKIIQTEAKSVSFVFEELPEGEYALRCFLDTNKNGKLDKVMFKPVEPYGFSWKHEVTFPFNFEDISFRLNKDHSLLIKLE